MGRILPLVSRHRRVCLLLIALLVGSADTSFHVNRASLQHLRLLLSLWMASRGVDVINMWLSWGFDGLGDGTGFYSNAPLNSEDAAVTNGII